MSTVEAFIAARSAGIQIRIDGDDLALEAPAPPPPPVLDLVARRKAAIVTRLRPRNDGWSEGPGSDPHRGAIRFAKSLITARCPRLSDASGTARLHLGD